MKKSKKATPRQRFVFETIARYKLYYREMPTYQQIAGMINRSRTTAFEHVQGLIDKGYLTSQGTIRGLEFTGKK